jgi:hypothetical protein
MDNLENLIKNYREEIQNDFPPEGHFERFEMKLKKRNSFHPNYWIGFLSGIAAVLIIGFIFFSRQEKQDNSIVTLSSISKQYAEVEFFYTSTINNQTIKLNDLTRNLEKEDPSLETIANELKEYDRTFQQICSELKASPNDERVISAMISYYQTKLEIINRILNELENKQVKSKSHENTNI